jgi:hypothetical protein
MNMAEESTNSPDTQVEVLRFRNAYERTRAEIDAVSDEQLVQINVDIPSAVTTALGALPEIRAMRPRLVEELPKFDLARFDKLEQYTLAAGHAHTLYLAASMPAEAVPELAEQCMGLCGTFRTDAEALVRRKLLDGVLLKSLKGTVGYRDIAFDLFTLVQILRENWPRIQGKTALSLAELNQAEVLADRLTTAIGAREQAPAVVGSAAESRHRAFSLFMRTYNEARRAIGYLAPDEVDQITPTVYVPRGPSKKRSEPEVQAPQAATPASAAQVSAPIAQPPAATKVASDSPYTV